ncbi:MAG: hypothetical protein QG568_217 [Patescibacteria group bacterium]|nr:hypothetical protein [Patescibacteria group bacterium]
MLRNSIINFTLKLGLAFSLFYTGLACIIVPDYVILYWPNFLSSNLSESFLIFMSGLVSFGLIAWIFSNKLQFASSTTMTVLLVLAGLFNLTNVPFIVDIAPLFFISLALSLRYYPRVRIIAQTKVTPLASVTVHDDLDEVSSAPNSSENNSTETVVESDTHLEHDQHIFVPKQ